MADQWTQFEVDDQEQQPGQPVRDKWSEYESSMDAPLVQPDKMGWWQAFGKMLPQAYGQVKRVPFLAADAGGLTTLAEDLDDEGPGHVDTQPCDLRTHAGSRTLCCPQKRRLGQQGSLQWLLQGLGEHRERSIQDVGSAGRVGRPG